MTPPGADSNTCYLECPRSSLERLFWFIYCEKFWLVFENRDYFYFRGSKMSSSIIVGFAPSSADLTTCTVFLRKGSENLSVMMRQLWYRLRCDPGLFLCYFFLCDNWFRKYFWSAALLLCFLYTRRYSCGLRTTKRVSVRVWELVEGKTNFDGEKNPTCYECFDFQQALTLFNTPK